jgi:spermidine/putrescine transport system permease protein
MIRDYGQCVRTLPFVALFLFLYVPLSVLIIFSFNRAPFPAPWAGGTFEWYRELFGSWHLWSACLTSLYVAIVAATLSVVMGLALVFYGVLGGSLRRLAPPFYINLIIPEIVLAVALVTFFAACGIQLGYGTLIVAHTVLGLGYVVPIVAARYEEIDRRLIEASLDLGATRSQTFWAVIVPLVRPSLLATALLVFILSFDDFVLTYFCAGSSVQTLSLYLISVLRSGVSPVINALATILCIVTNILGLIFCSLTFKERIF